MARLFFAVWPDPECARELAALGSSVARQAQGKAVPAGKIHLTLAFLGSVDDSARARAIAAATEARFAGFEAVIDCLGSFLRARVAWAGMSSPPGPLLDLQAGLDGRLRAGGFELEARPFAPHVTLVRKTARPIAPVSIAPIRWRVEALTLVRSETGTGRYVVERSWDPGG